MAMHKIYDSLKHTRFMGLREPTYVFFLSKDLSKNPCKRKLKKPWLPWFLFPFTAAFTPQPSNLAADPLKSPKGLQSLQWQNPVLAGSGEASMERPVFYVKTGTAWM
jgi:hypothetical protein